MFYTWPVDPLIKPDPSQTDQYIFSESPRTEFSPKTIAMFGIFAAMVGKMLISIFAAMVAKMSIKYYYCFRAQISLFFGFSLIYRNQKKLGFEGRVEPHGRLANIQRTHWLGQD